jgi:predicted DNA-binding transcriptional regulator AlpA
VQVAESAALLGLRHCTMTDSIRPAVLAFDDLCAFGVTFSRRWARALIRAGQFPAPIEVTTNRRAWLRVEIKEWLATKAAARPATNGANAAPAALPRRASRQRTGRIAQGLPRPYSRALGRSFVAGRFQPSRQF